MHNYNSFSVGFSALNSHYLSGKKTIKNTLRLEFVVGRACSHLSETNIYPLWRNSNFKSGPNRFSETIKSFKNCKVIGKKNYRKRKKDWRIKLAKTSGTVIVFDIFEEMKEGNQNMNKKQKVI